MYTVHNFKSGKAVKDAVAAYNRGEGPAVTYKQPGGLYDATPSEDGEISLEGPHFPAPHSWYLRAWVSARNPRVIVKVR